MSRTLRALALSLIFVAGFMVGTVLLAVVIQLAPGHGDPLCGRDCYPVEVQR